METVKEKQTFKQKLQGVVPIPIWLITIILGVIMAIFVFNRSYGSIGKQVEVNTKRLDVIEVNKADKSDIDQLRKSVDEKVDKSEFGQLDKHLNKIEDLIMQHMGIKGTNK